jgi:hypothetical protein
LSRERHRDDGISLRNAEVRLDSQPVDWRRIVTTLNTEYGRLDVFNGRMIQPLATGSTSNLLHKNWDNATMKSTNEWLWFEVVVLYHTVSRFQDVISA